MISAADITYAPFAGAPSTRRPIRISPAIRRAIVGLFIWTVASLLLGGIGGLLHHDVAVMQDSGLCKR
jgi:hypothetical protein